MLAAQGSFRKADDESEPISAGWILHVPSGKIISFDDLFVDADVVRRKISDDYRRSALPSNMGYHAFIGDDAAEQAATFREAYRRAAYRVSEPISGHFRDVRLTESGVTAYFSNDGSPQGDGAAGGASPKYLRRHLKAKYVHALDLLRVVQVAGEGLQ